MVATLPFDLRGLRDRALLHIGFAAGTRRSERVGLDRHRDDTLDAAGWVEMEVGGGSSARSCPVAALETWLDFAKIDHIALFRRVSPDGARALEARLSDKHVARLVKATVRAAGLYPELFEAERLALYSGQSLRAGLAFHAEANEADVQR